MNTLEKFTSMKKLRDSLFELKWQSGVPSTRLFYPYDGRSTQERTWDAELQIIAQSAISQTERCNGTITFYGGDVIGQALKKLVIAYLDGQLHELAIKGKKEAEDLLKLVTQ